MEGETGTMMSLFLVLGLGSAFKTEPYPYEYADQTGELTLKQACTLTGQPTIKMLSNGETYEQYLRAHPTEVFAWKYVLDKACQKRQAPEFLKTLKKIDSSIIISEPRVHEQYIASMAFCCDVFSAKSTFFGKNLNQMAPENKDFLMSRSGIPNEVSSYPGAPVKKSHLHVQELRRLIMLSRSVPEVRTQCVQFEKTFGKSYFSAYLYADSFLYGYFVEKNGKGIEIPGNPASSIAAYEKLTKEYPNQPTPHYKLAMLLPESKKADALTHAKTYLKLETRLFNRVWVDAVRSKFKL
jgi:hypothetical protein